MIGMDPCGMIFGAIRSCYTTKARLVHGSDRESTVRWYVAPDGALYFPDRHCMQPLLWTNGSRAPNPQGEVIGRPRPWFNGETPDCVTGQAVWGQHSWFNDGVPSLLPAPWNPNACGLPDACPAPITCQPWHTTNFLGRVLVTAGQPYVWSFLSSNATTVVWKTPAPLSTLQVSFVGGQFCLGFVKCFVGMHLSGFANVQLHCIGFNPATNTGTWRPNDPTQAPTGFTATITIPP